MREENLSSEWPEYLLKGFEDATDFVSEEELVRFREEWGGVDFPHIKKALSNSSQQQLIALCVIGNMDEPEVVDLLLPFLSVSDTKQRWMAALYLGPRREERAYQALCTMLTEFVPLHPPYPFKGQGWREGWLRSFRKLAAWLLHDYYEREELANIYGNALTLVTPYYFANRSVFRSERWYEVPGTLAYLLGTRMQMKLIERITNQIPHLELRKVLMVAAVAGASGGYDERWETYGGLLLPWECEENIQLREDMGTLLKEYFHFSDDEIILYLSGYGRVIKSLEMDTF